jgi:hypothetical protein
MYDDVEIEAEETTTAQATPWYRTNAALLIASIVLPPAGLLLLWMRRDIEAQKKALASLCIVALGAGYLYLLFGRRPGSNDDQYTMLEQHRAEQRRQAELAAQAGAPDAQTTGAPAAPGQPAAPGTTVEGGQPADRDERSA